MSWARNKWCIILELYPFQPREGSLFKNYFTGLESYMNRSHKYSFIFFFIFLHFLSLDQLIFFINYAWNLIIYKFLYVILFLFILPCNTINHAAQRKYLKKKICSIYFELFLFYFILVAVIREKPRFETSLCVSNPSIYMNLSKWINHFFVWQAIKTIFARFF